MRPPTPTSKLTSFWGVGPTRREWVMLLVSLAFGVLIGQRWHGWTRHSVEPGLSGSLTNPLSSLDDEYLTATNPDAKPLQAKRTQWSQLTELIMVAGHAIYTASNYDRPEQDASWSLEEYQKGQASTFVAHIRAGVSLAASRPHSLLMFSGGETRWQAGPINQATSYWIVAEHAQWYGHTEVRSRATTEMYARDSYDNLLFSICRFYELTGRYPKQITVVGFTFKRERFIQLHRHAIRYPVSSFFYVGVDPPDVGEASVGEQTRSFGPFLADPYSCSAQLRVKKEGRNPFRRSIAGYADACPHLRDLLYFCGPHLFPYSLPWTVPGY